MYSVGKIVCTFVNSKKREFKLLKSRKVNNKDVTLFGRYCMYVCMSVCMSHNQIIRLNEKVNLPRIEPKTFGIEV